MKYNDIGMNVDGIIKLFQDLCTYMERINKTFDQISDVVDQTKTFYVCEAADNYRNKFNSFKTNFGLTSMNLVSYAQDLIRLKNKYQIIDSEVTETVKVATAKMEDNNYGDRYE